MNYIIFAEKELRVLNMALEKANFKTKLINDTNIEIEVTKKNKDDFIKIISIYLSSIYYKEYYKKYVSNELYNIEDRVIEKIVSLDIENNENKIYIVQNLNILLKEYFKDNNILCIDSFLMFNASGFKKDIKFLAEMYCESCDDDLSSLFMNNANEDDYYEDEDIDDIIDDILDFENAVKSAQHTFTLPEDMHDIKRLDIVCINGRITFLANETKKIEMNSLKSILTIETLNDTLDNITIAYIIVGAVALLNIKKLVIHRSISKKSFDFFIDVLSKIKDNDGLKYTSIYKCKSDECSKCKIK